MELKEIHSKAIEIADLAFINQFKGNISDSIVYFQEALKYEKRALEIAIQESIGEPTRSILAKSAASLALNTKNYREAERLIALGLSGEPPHEIAEELRNLYEEINFSRHLETHGINLDQSEMQMVVAGNSVGFGLAKSDDIIDRLNVFEKITYRTVERIAGKPFREKGIISKNLKQFYQPYISVPRQASFAFTIRLGKPSEQLVIEGTERETTNIIDEIFDNIKLVNESKVEILEEKITDKAYLRNFVALSKQLAPDGENIKLVGLTIKRNGVEKKLEMIKTKNDLTRSMPVTILSESLRLSNEIIEIVGKLTAADSTKGNIRIISTSGAKTNIVVPEGLGDIVRNLWEEEVSVKGYLIKGNFLKPSSLTLIDIDKIK